MIRTLDCNGHKLELGRRTLIMGILNITPDSFSDGGAYNSVETAVQRAKQMVAEGADIIDIGGESTRPGSAKVSLEEELARVIPIIRELKHSVSVPLSIDTYKAEVARQALQAGAHIINDVWGGQADPGIRKVAADFQCPYVLTHNRTDMNYKHFLQDVLSDLRESIQLAVDAGVREEQLILDPGFGFAKTQEQNLSLMGHLRPMADLGFPVLLGTSRKTFIRNVLQLPPEDVVEGTAVTVALGIAQGCEIVRVHDVMAMKRVALMTDAIVRRTSPDTE
ncbi:Dihydropteroate synthase [compost metagenome]